LPKDFTTLHYGPINNRQCCGYVEAVIATQLGSLTNLNENGFRLLLQGPIGAANTDEESTNLLTWDFLTSITLTNSPWPVTDPVASRIGSSFYRTRLLP